MSKKAIGYFIKRTILVTIVATSLLIVLTNRKVKLKNKKFIKN